MSLASIDSEGSWLSGGAGHRRSANMRDSVLRANRRERGLSSSPANSTEEDLGIMDDEYMTRLTPVHSTFAPAPRPSGDGLPSSDEEDNGRSANIPKWGAVGALPQFVHRQERDTVRSRHALLNIDSGDEDNGNSSFMLGASPSLENARIEQANTVPLGKGHARNFSAGSAKTFDVAPRTSADGKM